MYVKKSIRRAPEEVRALMRIASGLELELRALKRAIEARRDLHQARTRLHRARRVRGGRDRQPVPPR